MVEQLENERKFLLKKFPPEMNGKYTVKTMIIHDFLEDGTRLSLLYDIPEDIDVIATGVDHDFDNRRYEITVKTDTADMATRLESKQIIEKTKYKELIKDSVGTIKKIRYTIREDNYAIEVDNFINIKLCMCEIEIMGKNKLEDLKNIKLPDYINNKIILEVTDIRQFRNDNLAI